MRAWWAALVLMTAPTAVSARCDLLLMKDDLPDCVRELNDRVQVLELQLGTAESQTRLYQGYVCLLAGELQKLEHNTDLDQIRHDACVELFARVRAKAAAKSKK